MKKYIFVLCPPYQGSTIIAKLLDSSEKTTSFMKQRGEGHLWFNQFDKEYDNNRWNPSHDLNIVKVKECYEIHWDLSKNIYVEKSPPIICRAKMYEDYFSRFGEVHFIISIRNPYSIGRHYDADKWVEFAEYQKYNIENLNNTIITSYEELCLNTNNVMERIMNNIPELGAIVDMDSRYLSEERGKKIIKNKVHRLINVKQKNIILKDNIDILTYFGYNIIDE